MPLGQAVHRMDFEIGHGRGGAESVEKIRHGTREYLGAFDHKQMTGVGQD